MYCSGYINEQSLTAMEINIFHGYTCMWNITFKCTCAPKELAKVKW